MAVYLAKSIVVTGRVQGVGFRWVAKRRAEELGIVGSARNAADGTVVIAAEGDADALERFLAWCRDGPPLAQVERVHIETAPPTHGSTFEIQ